MVCPLPLRWEEAAALIDEGTVESLGRLGRSDDAIQVYREFMAKVRRMAVGLGRPHGGLGRGRAHGGRGGAAGRMPAPGPRRLACLRLALPARAQRRMGRACARPPGARAAMAGALRGGATASPRPPIMSHLTPSQTAALPLRGAVLPSNLLHLHNALAGQGGVCERG